MTLSSFLNGVLVVVGVVAMLLLVVSLFIPNEEDPYGDV